MDNLLEVALADPHGMACVGAQNGRAMLASADLIARVGVQGIRRELGLSRTYPVKTGLGAHDVVWVEGDSHEDAVNRYFATQAERKEK